MLKILVTKTPKGYMAEFVGDLEVLRLFGTTTIPTAFSEAAHIEDVIEELGRLNPRHAVRASR